MNSIPTKQIDGDVAVGRNINIGGKATIRGSAKVGHNLKVDGWLEAPNIKGANKGIFLTVQELREAYPNPDDGWMAGVGASTPFAAYIGKGGDWVASGGSIEVSVDMNQFVQDVEQLQQDINLIRENVRSANTQIDDLTKRSQGDPEKSSAYTYAFINLGEFSGWDVFSSKLNSADLMDKKYMGRCRATVSGITVEVYQFINSFSASNYTQVILGNVSAGDNGQVRFTPNNFNIIHRQHKDGSWSAWQRINDHPLATSSLDGLMSASDKAALDAAKSDIASLQSSKADKAALDIQLNIVSNIATSAQMKSTGNAADIATLKGRVSGLEEVAVKIGRSVAIGEIGSLFTSDLPSVQSGAHCGLWQVKSGNYIIGVLEVFVDGMYHCISQKLSTNCTVNADGTIDGNGHQHTVRQYYRMYNVRWSAAVLNDGVTPWPVGTWSAWTSCDREVMDVAAAAMSKAEENAAAIADNEASIAENASAIACNKLGCTVRFDGFVEEAEIGMLSFEHPEGIYYVNSAGLFAARIGEVYANNWPDADQYLDETRSSVLKDKAYLCDGNLYVWDDTAEGLVLSCQNRCVAVEDMGSFFSEDVKGVFSGRKGGLWKVMKGNICVGSLEVFGDNNRHCITEVLTTNFTVDDDGVIGNGHQHSVRQYYRMYNVNWPAEVLMDGETPWPLNTWSAWTSCDREALDAARAYTLEAAVPRTFINASRLLGISEAKSLDSVTNLLSERGYGTPDWIGLGTVITFLSEDGWKNYRFLVEDASGGLTKAENWQEFGSGNAAVGNIYNVTNEQPIQGYYDLETAVAATFENGFAKQGVQITFAIARGSWKTYQYIGLYDNEENVKELENWLDLAGMTAGEETLINVDKLCGACEYASYYTLEYAIAAIKKLQESKNITYAKSGLVITYKIAENTWETKQFNGAATDFGEAGLWKDFGGGGSKVETSDTPEEGGEDALSTGGAYAHIPATLAVDTETEGTIKLHMQNAAGDMIGDEVQFAVGTGSGGGTGTTIAVAFKENPLYANAGSSFVVKAAIMSITKAGSNETSNSIMSVNFVNRTTKKVVATFQPKKASSATLTDYSFEFDLSSLCTQAGELPLQAQITDDGGNTATKNISLIAVDVTCVSVQTLNYTKDTSLEVGGMAKNIPLYKFPNNASDKGILVKVEIYKAGEWQVLTTATITDTYSHNVLINPSGLAHGAYPIRIQGEDVSSGVKGNVLHTSVMVIQQDESLADYNTPIVAARWSDSSNGTLKLFETQTMDVACYQRNNANPTVEITMHNITKGTEKSLGEKVMNRSTTYTIEKRLTEYSQHDVLVMRATCGSVRQPEDYQITIDGSLLDISETTGELFTIDLSGRSNQDTDKRVKATCADGSEVEITVIGSNYSSNGFVKDSYGTTDYGTAADNGRMALRIAEDVRATSNIKPYANSAIETNGSALSFTTMVKNVADRNAVLMQCRGEKMGFVLTGEKLVVYTNGDTEDAGTSCTIPYAVDMVHRFDIVVEPHAIAPYGGIGCIKVFKDGDEAGAVRYTAGAYPTSEATIEWDGTDADIYLYCMKMWNTYYNYKQAFDNYLIGVTDTDAMIREYEKNNVLASQTAEGTTKDRPSMQKCLDAGLCVVVLTKTATSDDIEKNYPDYLEGLDGDKKTTIPLDWYVYFPDRPWQNCIITNDPTSNQGTTSSWRKIKNKKAKHKKSGGMRLMYTREEISDMFGGDPAILAKYDLAASMAKKKKLQVKEGGQFTNITTIKVDYSDSCGAHNGAMMELMNDTQRALGDKYMTPAQVYNEGDFDIQTSIDSVPCALFRTDHYMTAQEATDPANAYFHAKANFNADKGDATFFGFESVTGYNSACLNYGDFVELVGARNQSIDSFKREVLGGGAQLVAGNIYVLSEWCGPNRVVLENDGTGSMQEVSAVDSPTLIEKTMAEVKAMSVKDLLWNVVYLTNDGHYMQYQGGNWRDTTGTMTFNSATKKWSVTGRVVNPVECYELLKYDFLNWMQGCNSVDDLMVIDESTGAPIWMSYYESRYPDDDDLNALYEEGKKVPYQLYRWLRFCQECNHHLTEADGNITLGTSSVPGTKANRLKKWEQELKDFANVHSVLCYTVASDYKATVDQRSKNAMMGFYLDTDGKMRMYLNHWYDGDCVDGSDNDCGLTIPWDMDARTSHLYQGWDSVIFQQTYAAGQFLLNGGTVTLQQVADAMRKVEWNNIKPFSADGCYHYWVTKRLEKWAKVISSFDGERKYIQNSTPSDNYFFALHGLRLDDLPDYQRKRFKYCDGQFQVGDLYTNPFKARMMGPIEITITAAQDGFFGLGEDRADACADSCHLLAGESYTMKVGDAQESGKMIYIFGADKLAKLDISKCTPKLEAFSLEYCTLLEELIVGGEGYMPAYTTGVLSALELPAMPFLKRIDIRNTKITTLSAKNCPRLKEVLASGSSLKTFTPSESAPLETLQLPASMTALQFVNLPKLTYPNGGMTIEGLGNVTRLQLSGCPNIDGERLLEDIIGQGGNIAEIYLPLGNVSRDETILQSLKASGARGIGSELKDACDGLTGRWVLTRLIDEAEFAALAKYFPDLELYNAQYTMVVQDDTMEDPANVTNLENGTTGDDYQASGHILRIRERMVPVTGKLNTSTGVWEGERMSNADYTRLADGTEFDYKDSLGSGNDAFMRVPALWYKGINDFKNQKKYTCWSILADEPLSTASKVVRKTLSDIIYKENSAVIVTNVVDGVSTLDTEGVLTDTPNINAYAIDVEGMKQVRWPGMNNATIGAVFLNADGIIIGHYNMAVNSSMFDFMDGDYVFIDVPYGAKTFVFAAKATNNALEAIAVDSTEVEAIEPDWVRSEAFLGGIYHASVDTITQLRSISGANVRVGTGKSTTSSEWTYDAAGKPTNTPLGTLNYTGKDFQNLAARRGNGYQLIDYEMSKLMAVLYYSLTGNRDAQLLCGYGRGAGGTTGYADAIGNSDSYKGQLNGNKCMGFESFFGCGFEFVDNFAVNVPTYAQALAERMSDQISSYPIDAKWHIWDPTSKTERVVQGVTSSRLIARTRHGRYCDVIASMCGSDSSVFSTHYCDGGNYTGLRCRFPSRSHYGSNASGGLLFFNNGNNANFSNSYYGSRLAFRGAISVKNDVA